MNNCSSIKITIGCSRQTFHCMLQACIGSEWSWKKSWFAVCGRWFMASILNSSCGPAAIFHLAGNQGCFISVTRDIMEGKGEENIGRQTHWEENTGKSHLIIKLFLHTESHFAGAGLLTSAWVDLNAIKVWAVYWSMKGRLEIRRGQIYFTNIVVIYLAGILLRPLIVILFKKCFISKWTAFPTLKYYIPPLKYYITQIWCSSIFLIFQRKGITCKKRESKS